MTFGVRKMICRIQELRIIGTVGIRSQLPAEQPALFCEQMSKYRVDKCCAQSLLVLPRPWESAKKYGTYEMCGVLHKCGVLAKVVSDRSW